MYPHYARFMPHNVTLCHAMPYIHMLPDLL